METLASSFNLRGSALESWKRIPVDQSQNLGDDLLWPLAICRGILGPLALGGLNNASNSTSNTYK
jgi:hypothetical protein